MARGNVEIFNLTGVQRRADAILERGRDSVNKKRYVWLFGCTLNEGVLGSVVGSDGREMRVFNARNGSEILSIVSSDRSRPANRPSEVLICEAQLLLRDDLKRVKNDLTSMGIDVRLYREK